MRQKQPIWTGLSTNRISIATVSFLILELMKPAGRRFCSCLNVNLQHCLRRKLSHDRTSRTNAGWFLRSHTHGFLGAPRPPAPDSAQEPGPASPRAGLFLSRNSLRSICMNDWKGSHEIRCRVPTACTGIPEAFAQANEPKRQGSAQINGARVGQHRNEA